MNNSHALTMDILNTVHATNETSLELEEMLKEAIAEIPGLPEEVREELMEFNTKILHTLSTQRKLLTGMTETVMLNKDAIEKLNKPSK